MEALKTPHPSPLPKGRGRSCDALLRETAILASPRPNGERDRVRGPIAASIKAGQTSKALRLRGEIAQAEVRAEGIGERACVQRIERRQASKAAGFAEGYNRAFDLLAGLAGKNNAVHSDRAPCHRFERKQRVVDGAKRGGRA